MTDPDTTAVRADHERIWLEPRTPDDCYGSDGRTWCQDNVWPEHEGQPEPTEYVRADIAASELATLRESLAKAEEARSTWHRRKATSGRAAHLAKPPRKASRSKCERSSASSSTTRNGCCLSPSHPLPKGHPR